MADSSALLQNYARYPVEFTHGSGAYLYDASGKEYLDFLSGIAVCNFGHRHPSISRAVMKQLSKLWHTSNLFESSLQERLAHSLVDRSGLDYAFFCNSGTEANEAAIKFARKYGNGRSHIITTEGAFHGRTMGSLSATWTPSYKEPFEPLVPGFSFVPYGDAEATEPAIREDTVAIIVEPIQGENGIIIPPAKYFMELRTLCDKHDLLLILDEVQTGMGRTGKMFCFLWSQIKPDIVTLAKGIANGFPLGAVLCTKEVGDLITPGLHGSTFGGNPVAVASACAVTELIDAALLEHVQKMGRVLMETIRDLQSKTIVEVRGQGLMVGVQFEEGISAKAFTKGLLEEGVVVGTSGDSVLRLLPPFVIREKEIERFLSAFCQTLKTPKVEPVPV
jgi:predicted acetylornithine/succinylornithine family transaminase